MLQPTTHLEISLPKRTKQAIMLSFDAISIVCIIYAAFWIRLGHFFYPSGNELLLIVIYGSPLLAIAIFTGFGLYREVIRFVGFKALWNIIQASSIYAILWGLMVFMANIEDVPRSVILINWVLVTLVIGSSRLFARWLFSEATSQNRVVIYGAGSAGRQLLNALKHSKEYNPIAFIDDSASIHNNIINGLKIYSPDNLQRLIDTNDVKAVLIAMPSLKRSHRQEIISFLEPYKVEVRSVPGVAELAQGKVKVNDLLEIDLSVLLGRESVKPNKELFKKNISNKVVMVTGAGGSIGSELCRQIILLKPRMLVLYEVSEPSLYQIDQELKEIIACRNKIRERSNDFYSIFIEANSKIARKKKYGSVESPAEYEASPPVFELNTAAPLVAGVDVLFTAGIVELQFQTIDRDWLVGEFAIVYFWPFHLQAFHTCFGWNVLDQQVG